ncbi:MAG: 50S ribosomal protein L33 [Candidatus Peribacteria bacterium]|nr:MAG: 50S ribosomal protein L33 [Candidatus Peribacteria bacterium]
MAKKETRVAIKLRSASGYCYFTTKNKMTQNEKMKLMKYDPNVRQKVEFVESGKLK